MSNMIRAHRRTLDSGEMNILLIPLILVALFFVGTASFAYWSYTSREDYRLNVNYKIDAAVKIAKEDEGIVKDKEHAETDKNPLRTYIGPEQFGSVHVSYPRTWSGYVSDNGSANDPLDGYFQPGVVPNITETASTFALRVQVLNQSYTSVIEQFDEPISTGAVIATPYAFPKLPNVVGIRLDGALNPEKKIIGSMMIVPLRDKTLEIWNESPVYVGDFNKYILPNVTFVP